MLKYLENDENGENWWFDTNPTALHSVLCFEMQHMLIIFVKLLLMHLI